MRSGRGGSTINLVGWLYSDLNVSESGVGNIGGIEDVEEHWGLVAKCRRPYWRVGLNDRGIRPDVGQLAVCGQGRLELLPEYRIET